MRYKALAMRGRPRPVPWRCKCREYGVSRSAIVQPSLWPDAPLGFSYAEAFIGPDEESELRVRFERLQFDTFEMRGVTARRRVKFFGRAYRQVDAAPEPIPDFLMPLRTRLAAWADLPPARFDMALVNEYRPGAAIGWHRDAPQYDIVAGVSVGAPCRMRLRPYVTPSAARRQATRRGSTHEIMVMPRSAYLLRGTARNEYEHSIPAVSALRYSVTFRTLREETISRRC